MSLLTSNQQDFRRRAVRLAPKIAAEYDLDWRLIAAAAILESGWGESALARRAHNYFGIRALSKTPEESVFRLNTPGGPVPFRKFGSMEESFHAYGQLLSQSKHYEPARAACAEARRAFQPFFDLLRQTLLHTFVDRMAPAYCPEDPDYGSKILQLTDLLSREEEPGP